MLKKIILILFLLSLLPIFGCECDQMGTNCCKGTTCSSVEVECVEGTHPVFQGCDESCMAQATCEKDLIQKDNIPDEIGYLVKK